MSNLSRTMPSWRNQFGESWDVPEAVWKRFRDESWGNDACPVFWVAGGEEHESGVFLWVDHPEARMRESHGVRYWVNVRQETVFESEDLGAVLAYVDANLAKWRAELPPLLAASRLLADMGATWEHPGFISVPLEGGRFLAVGDVNGPIAADLVEADGNTLGAVTAPALRREATAVEIVEYVRALVVLVNLTLR